MGKEMYKNFVSAIYVFNIIMQSLFTLLTPAAFGFLVCWIFVKKVGAPPWIYAIFLPLGIIVGFISMIKFVISASESLERLEQQRNGKQDKD